MGWFSKLLVIGVVGYGGIYLYKLNDKGYLSLPAFLLVLIRFPSTADFAGSSTTWT